jgi:muramidase (phage lysozyme)
MRAKEFIVEAPGRFRPNQVYELDNEKIEKLRNDPRVRVMLDLLGRAEGADYNTIVGSTKDNPKTFTDFSKHPRITGLTTQYGPSQAAGKFQIVPRTWDGQVKKLTNNGIEIKGFYPDDQEKVAISILNDVGALDPILKGNYKKAVRLSNRQWMSLPGTHMPQGYGPRDKKWIETNVADLQKKYELDKKDTQVAKTEPTTLDKVKNVATKIIEPILSIGQATSKTVPAAPKGKPGYYSVGDSHAQGIGSNSNDPNKNIQWTNFGRTGASAFSKEHLENIKKIPAGSVVTLSIGANDLGSKKLSDIVDQVNKTIAASKAQGHQVVYLLPTASENPRLQQKREELRQALLKSLESRDILDLGVAPSSKKLKGGDDVHLGPKGYKTYGDYITQMYTPGVVPKEPPKTQTEPTQPSPTPVVAPKTTTEPPVVKTTTTKTEPSVAQKYIDANTPQQKQQKSKLTLEPPSSDPEKDPKAWAEYDRQMEKIQAAAGEKFSKERQARLDKERLDKERLDKERLEKVQPQKSKLTLEPPDSDPEADPKAWAEYDKRMEKIQSDAADKLHREYQAAEKAAQSDDSYYTKFLNLFK